MWTFDNNQHRTGERHDHGTEGRYQATIDMSDFILNKYLAICPTKTSGCGRSRGCIRSHSSLVT